MSYLELYIGGSCSQDPIVSGMQSMYLMLPGLIDYHTSANASDEQLKDWKLEYNRWLNLFRKESDNNNDESLTEEEQDAIKYKLECWTWNMYDLLQKIGRYTNREARNGFNVE